MTEKKLTAHIALIMLGGFAVFWLSRGWGPAWSFMVIALTCAITIAAVIRHSRRQRLSAGSILFLVAATACLVILGKIGTMFLP